MQVVSNSEGATHRERLAAMLVGAEELLIASPFLFEDFAWWVQSSDLSTLRRFTLVTTLAPRGDDQLYKPASLISLLTALRAYWPNVRLRIQVDNRLHGKVYLVGARGEPDRGLVTSANFTRPGLDANHEWGIYTEDRATLLALRDQVLAAVTHSDLTETVLRQMQAIVDAYRRTSAVEPAIDRETGITFALQTTPRRTTPDDVLTGSASDRRIFLKPKGTHDRPIRREDHKDFGEATEILSFPRNQPIKNLRVGDIVIAFSTGERCVLSAYRVLQRPEEYSAEAQARDPHAKRWSWYTTGENLTPHFGSRWWDHALTIDELDADFGAGTNFNAFRRGAGRLLLEKSFGEYVLSRLMALESQATLSRL